ncbi:hypothetical protein [Alcaligenes sp. CHO6]|uniref:hypothetical protein n=1 Tax=Alcaligenes sp. CHO6 TaxID=3123298 RepID=UPI003014219F
MLAPSSIIDEVVGCAEWADRLVRADLINGFVVTENDYTSNFTGALRREINSRAIPDLVAHTQVLTPAVERSTGTDACIIFRNRDIFKVGLFEAKWPRLSTHANCWDSLQKSTGKSHFDSQLNRQNALSGSAVWEMFYSEEPYGPNPYFPEYGSSCVWHADAFAISSARTQTAPWADTELTTLLAAQKQGIGEVVRSICECRKGQPLPVGGMQNHLTELGIKGKVLVINLSNLQG